MPGARERRDFRVMLMASSFWLKLRLTRSQRSLTASEIAHEIAPSPAPSAPSFRHLVAIDFRLWCEPRDDASDLSPVSWTVVVAQSHVLRAGRTPRRRDRERREAAHARVDEADAETLARRAEAGFEQLDVKFVLERLLDRNDLTTMDVTPSKVIRMSLRQPRQWPLNGSALPGSMLFFRDGRAASPGSTSSVRDGR